MSGLELSWVHFGFCETYRDPRFNEKTRKQILQVGVIFLELQRCRFSPLLGSKLFFIRWCFKVYGIQSAVLRVTRISFESPWDLSFFFFFIFCECPVNDVAQISVPLQIHMLLGRDIRHYPAWTRLARSKVMEAQER